jgi:hypothetical protein
MMDDETRQPFDMAEAEAVWARTPGVLRAFMEALPDSWLETREAPGAWTPLQVLGHLVEAERGLWMPRARSILERGEGATFPPFERDGHLKVHAGASAAGLLDLFEDLRQASLSELSSMGIDADALGRRGRHPEFGPVSLAQLLATWVVHDLSHSRQIFRAAAKRYREAVGPWRQYLRVLEE